MNNGNCDCTGCTLSGNNCTINLTFHSDTAGSLQYSDIKINYDPKPFVYLISPENNSYSFATKGFTCNATDEINLKNVTLYIWNSTGLYNNSLNENITGISNSTNFSDIEINFSTTDTYYWNCLVYNNNSYSSWNETNYTLNVDVSTAITTLNYPSNNSWLNNGTNVNFNCTTEGDNLDSEFFYGNFTGTWKLNNSKIGITSGSINTFKLNLSDNRYSWTCGANKTTDGTIVLSQYGNYTFFIDTIKPVPFINSITTTAGSQTISFNSTATDTNLDSCKYSIYNSTNGIDGLNNNITFICNTNPYYATTTAYGNFTLRVYAKDLALNENYTDLNFTTSASVGITIIGGGGGSGTTKEIATNFSITSINLQNSLDNALAKDSKKARTKPFLLTNKGIDPITVTITCDTEETKESTRNISICDYVTFSETTFIVPPNEQEKIIGYVNVLTPDDSQIGDIYYFNILAVSKEIDAEKYSKLSVSNRVTFLSYVYKWSYLPIFGGDKRVYPVGAVSFFISFLFFLLIFSVLNKAKMPLTGFLIGILISSGIFISFLMIL
jgi:hypothetical protein